MTGDRLPMELCSGLGAGQGSVSVEVAADTRVGAEADNMQHIAGYFAVTVRNYYYLSIYFVRRKNCYPLSIKSLTDFYTRPSPPLSVKGFVIR